MSFEHQERMAALLDLAENALNQGELPIAAALYYKNQKIAEAFSSERQDQRRLVHAEYKVLNSLDQQHYTLSELRQMHLYTNLEPCMMCLGMCLNLFIGHLHYALPAASDGAVTWAQKNWEAQHCVSVFQLPQIKMGSCHNESKALFQRYCELHPPNAYTSWVQTLLAQDLIQ